MLVDPSNATAATAVTGAIRQAAQATGTSFQYLLATAQVESDLNPQAGAATSSARGLFQFLEQTWLGTVKQAGAALGYGRYADAITKTASGHYEVKDPAMRSQILKLRNDPTANAVMAGAFTQSNAAVLSAQLGRAPSEGELYIAHFLGAGGAARLIASAAAHPNASAASYFPQAAQANASIFYDSSTGATRTLSQVRDLLTARYDVAARSRPAIPAIIAARAPVGPDAAAAAATGPAAANPAPRSVRTIPIVPSPVGDGIADALPSVAAAVPDTAGMTNAFAAAVPAPARQGNEMFHGLFVDPGRSGPVAEVVSQLWGAGNPAPGASASSAAAPGIMHDLFKNDQDGA
ncbi:MAG TPA: transglycosylase SLT domain-containing protein [Xanthobacteraceae bacterium]|nr:transglycosylase SLT domain-containing protein [Xanthobacteraceae bacterium]